MLSKVATVNGLRKAYMQLYVQNATKAAYTETNAGEEFDKYFLKTRLVRYCASLCNSEEELWQLCDCYCTVTLR